jgi:predicted phage baseplate assembly protein
MSAAACGCVDACGCCEAHGPLTPLPLDNPPGLPQIGYRVGTQDAFKQTMLAALTGPLSTLTTREDDDPTIGLADAWACVLDVLTFYQERLANEGFLGTATERFSIRQLANEIGYELSPGAAACAYLAFELETAEGAPRSVTISPGVKVQSLPGQDEVPQTFETIDEIEAKPEWNAIQAQVTETQKLTSGSKELFLDGAANVKVGDMLLIVGSHTARRRVESVTRDPGGAFTVVGWADALGKATPAGAFTAYVLRTRAGLFGGNSPDPRTLPPTVVSALGGKDSTGDWKLLRLSSIRGSLPDGTIFLDAVYPSIVEGSWVVLESPKAEAAFPVSAAAEDARTGFGLTAKTTRLTLPKSTAWWEKVVRSTTVWGGAEELPLARARASGAVGGADALTIPLEQAIPTLPGDRALIVSGTSADTGEQAAELVFTAKPEGTETKQSTIALRGDSPLANAYERGTVAIAANVVFASHGETHLEVLGNGDAGTPFQRFTLKSAPLTYVPSADAPGGAATTLVVRVNDVAWHEHRDLYGLSGRDRAYEVRLDDDGRATVEFGDGSTGARVPSGVENVTARYRVGTGLAGMVGAGRLTLLASPPLGVRSVTNPFAATGAADAETGDDARSSAPLTVRTLDRTVSLDDFEDFAATFAGIGKAQASWLWSGERRIIVLTLAAADGTPLTSDSVAFDHLAKALVASGEPRRAVKLVPYRPLAFLVEAQLVVDPDYETAKVVAAAETALTASFAFAKRAFAQPVARSAVESTLQAVAGVVAVDLTRLDLVGGTAVNGLLLASGATIEAGVVLGAQLLQPAPGGISVKAP